MTMLLERPVVTDTAPVEHQPPVQSFLSTLPEPATWLRDYPVGCSSCRTYWERVECTRRMIRTKLDHLLITPLLFKRWLRSKRRSEEVGVAWVGAGCPLKTFLDDQLPDDLVFEVGNRSIIVRWTVDEVKAGLHFNLPQWASDFTSSVDNGERVGGSIYAHRAIDLLERSVAGTTFTSMWNWD